MIDDLLHPFSIVSLRYPHGEGRMGLVRLPGRCRVGQSESALGRKRRVQKAADFDAMAHTDRVVIRPQSDEAPFQDDRASRPIDGSFDRHGFKSEASGPTETLLLGTESRRLGSELDVIAAWPAHLFISLCDESELKAERLFGLEPGLRRRGIEYASIPIAPGHAPDDHFSEAWSTAGADLAKAMSDGASVILCCYTGRGRSALVATRLLVEAGITPDEAVRVVNFVSPGVEWTPARLSFARGETIRPVTPVIRPVVLPNQGKLP